MSDGQSRENTHTGRKVLIIVPAYNEAARIEGVLRDLSAHADWADVVIIDDGSCDGTAAAARRLGAKVLELPFNLGIGGAMQTGYLYAAEKGYDVAVQFDGDGQHRADEIAPLIQPVVEGKADLVIGSRLLGRRSYRFSPSRWIGSRLLVGVIRMVTGKRIADPTSGFRAASRSMIGFFARYYPQSYLGDTAEALVTAARHDMAIDELPARMRMTESSSIGNFSGLIHTIRICLALLIDALEDRLPYERQDSAHEAEISAEAKETQL